jgi:hypothetical protein
MFKAIYSLYEILWPNNCNHFEGGGGLVIANYFWAETIFAFFYFVYLSLMESSHPPIQEPSKDKKNLSRKKALCIVLFGDMGYFIFHLNKKT